VNSFGAGSLEAADTIFWPEVWWQKKQSSGLRIT
jgi:hypothetical protein